MSNKLCKHVISGTKKEEILMRDVLSGLEEIASMLCYDPWPGDFEIIAIYPPNEEIDQPPQEQTVVKTQPLPKAEIISYQQQRERLRRSA